MKLILMLVNMMSVIISIWIQFFKNTSLLSNEEDIIVRSSLFLFRSYFYIKFNRYPKLTKKNGSTGGTYFVFALDEEREEGELYCRIHYR